MCLYKFDLWIDEKIQLVDPPPLVGPQTQDSLGRDQKGQAWFRVSGFGFRVSGFWFRVSGFGFRVSGFGFLVSGFGFMIWGLLGGAHSRFCRKPTVKLLFTYF